MSQNFNSEKEVPALSREEKNDSNAINLLISPKLLKKFEVISNIIDGIPEVNQSMIIQKLINLDIEALEMTQI